MKRTAIITTRDTDLINIMRLSGRDITIVSPEGMTSEDFSAYDSVMFCGGTDDCKKPMVFDCGQMEVMRKLCIGKKHRLFAEFVKFFDVIKCGDAESTRYQRPVVLADGFADGLGYGDILEDQSNMKVAPYYITDAKVLLGYYSSPKGFYKIADMENAKQTSPALWIKGDSIMFSAFRLSDFCRACFAPKKKWFSLISYVIEWITGEPADEKLISDYYDAHAYTTVPCGEDEFEVRANEGVDRVIEWHKNAELIEKRDGKCYGIQEGLSPHVLSDGRHVKIETVRNDSTGETAFLYFLKYLQTGEARYLQIADELDVFTRNLITSYDNSLDGYGCWGIESFTVCYQDDTARGFLLPQLFRILYTGDRSNEAAVRRSLDFLVRTTSKNGLRSPRTDIVSFEPPRMSAWGYRGELSPEELGNTATGTPSAHYNGTYMASLLLAYKLFGDEIYRDTAVRGMTSFMEVYPNTVREHSETQEYCRLILPLALLYWVTGEELHKEWLYRVTADLERFKRANGSFIEWDTGYTANCAGVVGGESSVLDENGNPVVDMLYSTNWLPTAFAQAYFVTEDEKFLRLWRDVCRFMISIQIHSENRDIDGVWARAFDIDLNEVYGVPNDVGWAPWSVENGWTMAEIPCGILMGLMREKLIGFYR